MRATALGAALAARAVVNAMPASKKAQPRPTQSETVATILRGIATALELTGANRFRAQAYRRGADAVDALGERLATAVSNQTLIEVPGIGRALATAITEIARDGRSEYLDALRAELPPGALDLAQVPNLSLSQIKKLSDAGIRSAEDLRAAATDGRLAALRGFGAESAERLLAKMDRAEEPKGQILLVDALEIVAALSDHLRGSAAVTEVSAAGDVRRGCEVTAAIVVVAKVTDAKAALARFARFSRVVAIVEEDARSAVAQLSDGARLHLYTAKGREFPVVLQQLTGSVEHNAVLAEVARERGLTLARDALFEERKGRKHRVAIENEEDLYAHLHIAYVPPPLREADEPLRAASDGPRDLVAISDIRGMVHCHSTYSDGKASIEDMARAAEALGMKYLTITDHSPTASYANGVQIDRLQRQWDEIAQVQERVGIRLLRGTEADITKEGSLDYPDHILEQFDLIIGSIHNRYRLDEKGMTERILRGMRHPLFKIWGHALGRILLHRPPIAVDLDSILDTIAESNAAIEMNGDPYRLDMPPLLAKGARARGIKFVISVDAHSTRNYGFLPLGVTMAQRAGLAPSDVLNTLDTDAFVAAVKPTGSPRPELRPRRKTAQHG